MNETVISDISPIMLGYDNIEATSVNAYTVQQLSTGDFDLGGYAMTGIMLSGTLAMISLGIAVAIKLLKL